MILTTNRVSCFDAAVESRIHLTIDYPALDASSRLLVWRTFAPAAEDQTELRTKLSQEDLAALAIHELNGRQIKNIIKAGRLLAKRRNELLAMDHIDVVLRAKNQKFDKSLE